MIKAFRAPLEKAPLEFMADVLKNMDGKRVCAVVPTSRNLRILANKLFKTVELFAVKDFIKFADAGEGVELPAQLRPFYFKKAAASLRRDQKLTVFKKDKSFFFENFTAFADVSSGVLAFFRELATEMIDMEDLAKAGKYTDYEEQIGVLRELWKRYVETVEKEGYVEEWEKYRKPGLRAAFINRYDEFVFLVGGYVSKYELEQLKSLSKTKNVALIFNYAGPRRECHKSYEKYLEIELDDRPFVKISPSSTMILACPGMAAQLEFITRQAFYLNREYGVKFRKMGVVLPDESFKSYFLRLDPYNLFDIASNESVDAFEFYRLAGELSDIAAEIKKSSEGKARIENVIALLNSPSVKKLDEAATALEDIYAAVKNGKLYAEKREIEELPFFRDYGRSFLSAPEKIRPSVCAAIFWDFFKRLEKTMPKETLGPVAEAAAKAEMLERVFESVTEEMPFYEASTIIMSELKDIRHDTPKGKILVTGILESRNLTFDAVFFPAMNEEIFPPAVKKDMFLNTEIRKELGLPTFADRETLLKNYLLQLAERAKYTMITYTTNPNSRRRSRFAEEMAIKNGLATLEYAPERISLLNGPKRYFPQKKEFVIEKTPEVLKDISNIRYSPSAFNDYLCCPVKFYFKRARPVYPRCEPDGKITPRLMGSAFHKALEKIIHKGISASSPDFQEELTKLYKKELFKYDAYRYNPVERFRADEGAKNIPIIAQTEKAREEEGWRAVNLEQKIETDFRGAKLTGTIDRIDERDGVYEIIDYKFKEVSEPPKRYVMENQSDLQMPFYALLMEEGLKTVPANLYHFGLKSGRGLTRAFDMDRYDEFKDFFSSKLAEISSESVPFTQTGKISRCDLCDYAPVCGRK